MRRMTIAAVCLLAFGCSDNDDPKDDAANDAGADLLQEDGTKPDPDTNGDVGQADVGQDSAEPNMLACAALSNCWECCPSGDSDCKAACKLAMSDDDKKAWAAQDACISLNCTVECKGDDDACNECISAKCGDEQKACTWGAGGSGKCMVGFECFTDCPAMMTDSSGTAETCPTDPGIVCIQKCLSMVTVESELVLQDLGRCIYQKCADSCLVEGKDAECTSCRETECLDEYTACKKDT